MSKLLEKDNIKNGGELENKILIFLKLLRSKGFKEKTIEQYKSYLKRFVRFCNQHNITEVVSDETIGLFFTSLPNASSKSTRFFHTVINKFKDFVLYGTFRIMYTRNYNTLKSDQFNNYLCSFEFFLRKAEFKDRTIKSYNSSLKTFFLYLEKNNIFL